MEENKEKTKTNKNKVIIAIIIGMVILVVLIGIVVVLRYVLSIDKPCTEENLYVDYPSHNTADGIIDGKIHTDFITKKPIIYLYPEEETEIIVKLGKKENLICVYPKYPSNGWKVIAKPNGELTNIENGRKLYSLYYESKNDVDFKMQKEGFVVKGSDVAEFLEEKLEILGLTEREAEEFIVYWLPKLQENKYNYIRFATEEEINENMPLDFSIEPDTLIRVLMTFKGLDNQIEVNEQKLQRVERKGFVAVEWGGTEIK